MLRVILCTFAACVSFGSVLAENVVDTKVDSKERVHFSDRKLKKLVERDLGVIDPNRADMEKLIQLDIRYRSVKDLTGLEHAVNLRAIHCSAIYGTRGISALSHLPKLETLSATPHPMSLKQLSRLTQLKNVTLNLSSFKFKDISALSLFNHVESLTVVLHDRNRNRNQNLPALSEIIQGPNLTVRLSGHFKDLSFLVNLNKLKGLGVLDAHIADRSAIFRLVGLKELSISVGDIEEIAALSKMGTLQKLLLSTRSIDDLSALKSLAQLEQLAIYSPSKDFGFVSTLKQLRSLTLRGDSIKDISFLSNLTELESLTLSRCKIHDISALSGLTKLNALNLSKNGISDISTVSNFRNLSTLDLSSNRIADISSLSGLTQLKTLDLSSNSIGDISTVSNLRKLTNLNIRRNRIEDFDVSVLSSLPQLRILQLQQNLIRDESLLLELERLGGKSNKLQDIYLHGNPAHTSLVQQKTAMKIASKFEGQTNLSVEELGEKIYLSLKGMSGAKNRLLLGVRDTKSYRLAVDPPFFTIKKGWGDCLSGCIHWRTWKFKVEDKEVTLVEESGDVYNEVSVRPVDGGVVGRGPRKGYLKQARRWALR